MKNLTLAVRRGVGSIATPAGGEDGGMDAAPPPSAASLQATLFDFAIMELVRQHRDSFPPLWTTESWAKLLIWLALNCGCSVDGAGLEAFVAVLGAGLSGRMRRVFFERDLEDLNLKLMADPAEARVLALPLVPPLASGRGTTTTGSPIEGDDDGLRPGDGGSGRVVAERVGAALERVGLSGRVVMDRECWQWGQDLVAVPWAAREDG